MTATPRSRAGRGGPACVCASLYARRLIILLYSSAPSIRSRRLYTHACRRCSMQWRERDCACSCSAPSINATPNLLSWFFFHRLASACCVCLAASPSPLLFGGNPRRPFRSSPGRLVLCQQLPQLKLKDEHCIAWLPFVRDY